MKKIIIAILTLCIFIGLISVSISVIKNNKYDEKSKYSINNIQIGNKESKGETYKNLFITLLYPYVEKAISDYYRDYMTYLPGEDPWSYDILSIERVPNTNYSYIVDIQVQPYVGPHLSVGKDRITFEISLEGVKVTKFEHIESYELPSNYQNILKKKLPNTIKNTYNIYERLY